MMSPGYKHATKYIYIFIGIYISLKVLLKVLYLFLNLTEILLKYIQNHLHPQFNVGN